MVELYPSYLAPLMYLLRFCFMASASVISSDSAEILQSEKVIVCSLDMNIELYRAGFHFSSVSIL